MLHPYRLTKLVYLNFGFNQLFWIYSLIVAMLFSVSCENKQVQLPASDADNGGLILPGGFEALVVIDSAGPTRHIAVNDNGDIYAKLRFSRDKQGGTIGMRDLNGDGKADTLVRFGDYEDVGGSAVGVTIYDGYLYTSTVRQVLRNKLSPGELVPGSRTEVILTDTHPNVARNWHTTKPAAFDGKGNMYIPFGSPSDAGQDIDLYGPTGIPGGKGLDPSPEREMHAGIWKFDAGREGQVQADGTKFATGLRSIVGMTWSPLDDQLYAVVNGIDNFHTLYPALYSSWQAAVLPSEILVKVTEGADFGWPYAYYDQLQGKNVLSPAYGGDGTIVGRAAEFDEPVIGFPGHWAPMDLLFYQGRQFPDRYKQGVFVAFHGSTDRSPYPQAGYIVCFVPLADGKAGDWEVFADGFAGVDTVENTGDARYRPMGLAEGPDGSLYLSESNKGKIWRVMYKGDKKEFGEKQLQEMKRLTAHKTYIKTPVAGVDNLDKGSLLEGGILYNTYCATCHQRNGEGDNNRFPPLAGSERVLGEVEPLVASILNGIQGEITVRGKTYNGYMPPHANILDDHAVASISSYIRNRWGNKASPISPSEVRIIREKVVN
ncbi:Glucose/arabinose dehydrogenase, beta-propeller fold [Cyclobacterium lianum]|uniref:Glucose/arabinose dehydrogenase, beta-propeller fold n=1 Tax=Cyclobacterium lianum TaxID=388280 RepID=A0A1M7M4H1_9BACT|nr:c-type cytochrome [Cyclobacterium lianum]SHM85112.1 Glucose/arabinose dehydrogenase, beta-propeller fold [Cyclobacterium lianum]